MFDWLCGSPPARPPSPSDIKVAVTQEHGALVSITGIRRADDPIDIVDGQFAGVKTSTTRGIGVLIHPMLILTTHSTIPSPDCVTDAEITICREISSISYIKRKFVPDVFFHTDENLDLTVISCEAVVPELKSLPLDTTLLKPRALRKGHNVFILGCQTARPEDIAILDGKIIGSSGAPVCCSRRPSYLRFQTSGDDLWMPGSAGFDEFGTFTFIVTKPGKLPGADEKENANPPEKSEGTVSTGIFTPKIKQWGTSIEAIKEWLAPLWKMKIDEVFKGKSAAEQKDVKPKDVKKQKKKEEKKADEKKEDNKDSKKEEKSDKKSAEKSKDDNTDNKKDDIKESKKSPKKEKKNKKADKNDENQNGVQTQTQVPTPVTVAAPRTSSNVTTPPVTPRRASRQLTVEPVSNTNKPVPRRDSYKCDTTVTQRPRTVDHAVHNRNAPTANRADTYKRNPPRSTTQQMKLQDDCASMDSASDIEPAASKIDVPVKKTTTTKCGPNNNNIATTTRPRSAAQRRGQGPAPCTTTQRARTYAGAYASKSGPSTPRRSMQRTGSQGLSRSADSGGSDGGGSTLEDGDAEKPERNWQRLCEKLLLPQLEPCQRDQNMYGRPAPPCPDKAGNRRTMSTSPSPEASPREPGMQLARPQISPRASGQTSRPTISPRASTSRSGRGSPSQPDVVHLSSLIRPSIDTSCTSGSSSSGSPPSPRKGGRERWSVSKGQQNLEQLREKQWSAGGCSRQSPAITPRSSIGRRPRSPPPYARSGSDSGSPVWSYNGSNQSRGSLARISSNASPPPTAAAASLGMSETEDDELSTTSSCNTRVTTPLPLGPYSKPTISYMQKRHCHRDTIQARRNSNNNSNSQQQPRWC